mgnify:FL=1
MGEQTTVEKVREWLVYTVSLMVDYPDKVEVSHKIDDMGVLLTLKVDPSDAGRIIGKGGDTVNAIRKLLHYLGMTAKARVNLKLDVPEKPNYSGERG